MCTCYRSTVISSKLFRPQGTPLEVFCKWKFLWLGTTWQLRRIWRNNYQHQINDRRLCRDSNVNRCKEKKSRFVHINFKVMFIPFTTCCFLKLSYTLPRYLRSISKWPVTLIHHFSLRKSSVIDHLFKWTAIKYFPKYYNFPKCISIWKNLTQDHDTLDQYTKSLLIILRQLKVLNLCLTLRTKLFAWK